MFPDILLPKDGVPMETWAVIACDQFTADETYWNQVEEVVGDNPSTLRMILPEVYLEKPGQEEREKQIRRVMSQYLDGGVFRQYSRTAVFIRRILNDGTVRRGIVVAVDLEEYDYDPHKKSVIRASEQTIPERLPPRAAIRDGAPLESPHVLVLFDDPDDSIMAGLDHKRPQLDKVYDTPLMLGGGKVEGYAVPADSATAQDIAQGLGSLDTLSNYGYLFATGDGNHSLAAAKTVWTKRKAAGAAMDDPYRYCLVELVNVYDRGLPFHPINRLVIGNEDALLESFLRSSDARFHGFSREDLVTHISREGLSANEIAFSGQKQHGILSLSGDDGLAVGVADNAISQSKPDAVDYVHGLDEVLTAARNGNGIALILPEIDRGNLFSTVAAKGALPRKAFSLGEARDKRYYLECRRLEAVSS